MKKLTSLLLFIGTLFCISMATAQESPKSYGWATSEFLTISPVLLSGEISNTVTNVGLGLTVLDLGIFSFKRPGLIVGISTFDASFLHRYKPTPEEETIIDNIEIITTTTDQFGSKSTSSESLGKIRLPIWKPGLFIEFQPFIKGNQGISPYMRFILSIDILGSNLPSDGMSENRDISQAGIGYNFKIGTDFRKKDGTTLRFGYSLGILPDFGMKVLDGLRMIYGGTCHTIYVSIGINHYNQKRVSAEN